MRILFMSDSGEGSGIALKLKTEGNDVFMYIRNSGAKKIAEGIVEKVYSVTEGIQKAPDLIVFDSVGMGRIADKLKDEGWPVFGGSSWADKLELNSDFAKKAIETMGIAVPPENTKGFSDITLEIWYANGVPVPMPLGIIKNKKFMNGDAGSDTECQSSTVFAYDRKEPRLIQQSLKKMKPLMEKTRYTGTLGINGIVKRGRFYGVSFTASFSYNSIYAFLRILDEPLGEVLMRMAKGDNTPMKLKSGFGFSLRVSIPPYPYKNKDRMLNSRIYLETKDIVIEGIGTNEWGERVFPFDCYADSKGKYLTAGSSGVVLDTTGYGISVFDAEEEAVGLYDRVQLPQKQARLGDGARVSIKRVGQLAEMGYEVPPFLPKPEPLSVVALPQQPTHVSGGVSSDITKKPTNSNGAVKPIFHTTYNPGPRSG